MSPPGKHGLERHELLQAQRIERRLEHSPRRVHEPGLERYLQQLLERLDPAQESAISVYVLEGDVAQAEIIADRILKIRMALLLALRDEDELLFVLAHELAHRDLGHVAKRRREDWDPGRAEIEADRAALEAMERISRPQQAGLALLQRMAANAPHDAYRSALQRRIAALTQDPFLRESWHDGTSAPAERLPAVLDRYRSATDSR
jgi:predicted Zn-dependent protease